MRVLIACEESQIVAKQFFLKGHDVISCDIEYPGAKGLPHYLGNVLDILYDGWDLMVGHPVCTFMANSGVRWLKHEMNIWGEDAPRYVELLKGCDFFNKLFNAPIKKIALENPIPHKYAKHYIGNYNQIVQPWYFGDPYFKGTCLWLKNLPELQDTDRLIPPKPGTDEHKRWSIVHQEPPGPNRKRNRSRTFPGIAKAMAEQWG